MLTSITLIINIIYAHLHVDIILQFTKTLYFTAVVFFTLVFKWFYVALSRWCKTQHVFVPCWLACATLPSKATKNCFFFNSKNRPMLHGCWALLPFSIQRLQKCTDWVQERILKLLFQWAEVHRWHLTCTGTKLGPFQCVPLYLSSVVITHILFSDSHLWNCSAQWLASAVGFSVPIAHIMVDVGLHI